MKLVSKQGSHASGTTPLMPKQEEVNDSAQLPKKQAAPAPAQPEEQKHLYPEATLSKKQLAAIKSVLKPQAEQDSVNADIGQETSKKTSKSTARKKAAGHPVDIEMGDRSPVKTVFLTIIIILIISAAGFAGWYYWWTTYATFDFELQPVVMLDGQSVQADGFLYPEEELEGMSAVIRNPEFVPATGFQFVPLTLTLGWRSLDTSAALYVLTPLESVQHEFRVADAVLRPVDFLLNAESASGIPFTVRFAEELLPLEDYPVGEHTVHLALNDMPFEVILQIVDTTPPTATAVAQSIQIGEPVFPESFVTDVFDASPISSITFYQEPNVLANSDQTVKIAIEDEYGNVAIIEAELSIQINMTPPVIEGAVAIESEVGTPVIYLQGVTAFDDFGRELEVFVNDADVDQDTEGTYTAIYWAEDYTGLYSQVEVTVYIIGVDPQDVYQRVNEILDRILNDGMTQVEKVRAIHNWVMWNMSKSTAGIDSQSVLAGAHKALRDRRGDSNIYSSIAAVLLTEAGIPNMRIERSGDTDNVHIWNLIDPDDLGWHHFDAFPTGLVLGSASSMFTDAQAKDFERRIKAHNGTEGYYTYDTALYPEVVQE